jgi:hypothetical protein
MAGIGDREGQYGHVTRSDVNAFDLNASKVCDV